MAPQIHITGDNINRWLFRGIFRNSDIDPVWIPVLEDPQDANLCIGQSVGGQDDGGKSIRSRIT